MDTLSLFPVMGPVSRALRRHEWLVAVDLLMDAGVSQAAALSFVADQRDSAVERGEKPAQRRQ